MSIMLPVVSGYNVFICLSLFNAEGKNMIWGTFVLGFIFFFLPVLFFGWKLFFNTAFEYCVITKDGIQSKKLFGKRKNIKATEIEKIVKKSPKKNTFGTPAVEYFTINGKCEKITIANNKQARKLGLEEILSRYKPVEIEGENGK